MTQATARFTIETGRFITNAVAGELEEYAFTRGVDINIRRVKKDWMTTSLLVTVKGPAEKVDKFIGIVKQWIEDNET